MPWGFLLAQHRAPAHGSQLTTPQCLNERHPGCDPESSHTSTKLNQSTPQRDANSAHTPHVQFPGRERGLGAPHWRHPFHSARKQTQSTVGPGHSTVGPGPQYCGSGPTVLWCSQSDPTATHTNVECSQSARRRHSNIAHVTHRQLSGRIRGTQVSTSEWSARLVLECPCVAPTVLWVCFI